ncbi:hypothetical protein SAMN05216298_2643 [Glycomyces sambucus]|uniref:Antitoxin FitA-like ribbon-helix-helix domain-containing protein n=1 Tax=Glycomyces sambucus TaxID=380244 RepID=A0A1G9H686_9ACTN|nr:hypothetical protein [Glycomyces sambucus]SDL08355.1 hypothetical protein SAMN05216298_2643 [Glycomyces sambucus]
MSQVQRGGEAVAVAHRLIVRDIDPELFGWLRRRAAGNGRSMSSEAKAILAQSRAADEARRSTRIE